MKGEHLSLTNDKPSSLSLRTANPPLTSLNVDYNCLRSLLATNQEGRLDFEGVEGDLDLFSRSEIGLHAARSDLWKFFECPKIRRRMRRVEICILEMQ